MIHHATQTIVDVDGVRDAAVLMGIVLSCNPVTLLVGCEVWEAGVGSDCAGQERSDILL